MQYSSFFSVFYVDGQIKAVPLIRVTQAVDECREKKQDFLMHRVAAMDEDTACINATTSPEFLTNILKIISKDIRVTELRLSTPQTSQHWVENVEILARNHHRHDRFTELLTKTNNPR